MASTQVTSGGDGAQQQRPNGLAAAASPITSPREDAPLGTVAVANQPSQASGKQPSNNPLKNNHKNYSQKTKNIKIKTELAENDNESAAQTQSDGLNATQHEDSLLLSSSTHSSTTTNATTVITNTLYQAPYATPNTTKKSTTLKYPRSSNPNMSVSERVSSEVPDVRISKALAAVLRHGKMGFTMDNEGFVWVDQILTHNYFAKQQVTFEDIKRISVNPIDGIKRFFLIKDDVFKQYKIRALQGHTVEVIDLDLLPVTLDDTCHMPFAIHGTFWKAWEKIKNQGLKLQNNRTHLHFQPGTLGKGCEPADLVKRFRNNCEVLVYIDLAKIIEAGIRFYKSSNNVVLTKGDHQGRVPARFFLKAVHISPTTGEQIWVESLGNDDCVSQNTIIRGLEKEPSFYPSPQKGKRTVAKPRGPNPFPSRSRNASSTHSCKTRSRNPSENPSMKMQKAVSPIHN